MLPYISMVQDDEVGDGMTSVACPHVQTDRGSAILCVCAFVSDNCESFLSVIRPS